MEFLRLPRFKRSPAIAALRLTERDREILQLVHRYRFLRSDHFTSLLPGSPQQVLRRLQRLYHHGYLERPACQIDYYRSGSRRMVYGLGNKGAALLKRELALPFHRLDWPKKHSVGRLFLDHALLISDVMVAVKLACRQHPNIRLLSPEDIKLPTGTRKRDPFQWTVNLGRGRDCGVIPDCVFGLESHDKSGRKNRVWFCLEADRGTMPVVRDNLEQSSIHRKLVTYAATWEQNLHRKRFGWQRYRVLTVTSKPERVASMQQAVRSLKGGHGLFLFTDAAALNQAPNILTHPWQLCRGDRTTSLLD